jgi:hypothetical protein
VDIYDQAAWVVASVVQKGAFHGVDNRQIVLKNVQKTLKSEKFL